MEEEDTTTTSMLPPAPSPPPAPDFQPEAGAAAPSAVPTVVAALEPAPVVVAPAPQPQPSSPPPASSGLGLGPALTPPPAPAPAAVVVAPSPVLNTGFSPAPTLKPELPEEAAASVAPLGSLGGTAPFIGAGGSASPPAKESAAAVSGASDANVTVRLDCRVGFADCARGWSVLKTKWCFQHEGVQCDICTFGLPQMWSLEKSTWCCKTRGVGCGHSGSVSARFLQQPVAASAGALGSATASAPVAPAELQGTLGLNRVPIELLAAGALLGGVSLLAVASAICTHSQWHPVPASPKAARQRTEAAMGWSRPAPDEVRC